MKRNTVATTLSCVAAGWLVLSATAAGHAAIQFGGDATGLMTYDLEAYAGLAVRPGTALAVLADPDWGITFGEKLIGQITTSNGNFDVISGTPTVPLTIDAAVNAQVGILILSVSSSTVGVGLGAIGFPLGAAIGEGALTVLYDVDQRMIAFDLVGADAGALRLQFFNRAGQSIGDITMEGAANSTYVFSSDEANIAAVTFTNTDYSGLGFDNFRFNPDAEVYRPPYCNLPGAYDVPGQGDWTAVPVDSGVGDDPDGLAWAFSWANDCPGGYFDDETAPNPTLFVNTAGTCLVECSVTVVVDDGQESDVCTTPVTISGGEPASLTCPADLTVEADGDGNAVDLEEWLSHVTAVGGEVVDDFQDLTPACGQTGSATVTWTVSGGCGEPASCTATFTIVDTTPPAIELDTTPLVIEDVDCSGDEEVTPPVATATDAGGAAVEVTDDAPEVVPAGETATITYTATDDCGNTATATVDITVLYGAGVEVEVLQRTVAQRSGRPRGPRDAPLGGVTVAAYESGLRTCSFQQIRRYWRSPWQIPQAIATACEPVNTAVTDDAGMAYVAVPPGSYVVLAQIDQNGDGTPDAYLGQAVGRLHCGQWKSRRLVLHVDERGKRLFEITDWSDDLSHQDR